MKKLWILTTTLTMAFFILNPVLSQEKYAVIITGDYAATNGTWAVANGVTDNSPMEEFWNDTYLMWELLHDRGYSYDNIYVLFADGIDYTFFGQDDRYKASKYGQDFVTDLSATKENVIEVLTGLADGSNGYPQLTEDDFFYLYTFDHGYYTLGVPWNPGIRHTLLCLLGYDWTTPVEEWDEEHSIADFELQALLENINASKKLVIMQQCYSGGFIPWLEGPNTIIVTAASELKKANRSDQLYYDGISEPCDPAPGTVFTIDSEHEVYMGSNHQYVHGEFNLHLINSLQGKTPDGITSYVVPGYQDFPLSDADVNNDDIVSISESYDWIYSFNSRMRNPIFSYQDCDDPQLSHSNKLADYTSLEYPTLIFENIGSGDGIAVQHRGIIGISKDIHVTSGNQLQFLSNAIVYLLNDVKLIIDAGASLDLQNDVTIIGQSINNQIIVNGGINIGDNVTFTSEGVKWDLYLKNYELETVFENTTFERCKLHNYGESLTIYNSLFDDCYILYSHRGKVNINNTVFDRTWLYLENIEDNQNLAKVSGCSFTTDITMAAIDLWNYNLYIIENNTIDGYYNGIQILQSGFGDSKKNMINDNTITNCTQRGILAYSTRGAIFKNYISNNSYGVWLGNYSSIGLYGYSGAANPAQTQEIRENDSYEVYASQYSFPFYFRYNVIVDDGNIGGEEDALVFHNGGNMSIKDVRYNCWEEIPGSFNPLQDLYGGAYIWEPTWCPGSGSGTASNPDEDMFEIAGNLFEVEDYTGAKTMYETLIEQYPQSKYAKAAMQELFALEKFVTNDYNSLKQYYNANATIQAYPYLAKTGDYMVSKCDIKLENWPAAISYYESIILDPETMEDSIFAIVDLGYVYFVMENSGYKSAYTGNLVQYKPESKEMFFDYRNYLLSFIPGDQISETMKGNITGLKAGALLQNVPNPFKGNTQIWYKLESESTIELNVYNYTGQLIRSISERTKTKGNHFIDFDATGLKNGIYFYSININGQVTDTKKMTIMK
jgi:parallel beta-helix repeat protein